ncbi:MAG TPA: hypothetical protein VF508_05520 [Pyrinomonadaceae bacterium]
MMRTTPLKIFAAAALLSSAAAVAGARAGGDRALARLTGYRGWARVTREPLRSEQPFAGA